MKISSKLLIGLPVIVLLIITFCLKIAGEYKKTGVMSTTGYEVSQSGRVPAFSIVTIKGRAFSAQKPNEEATEQEATTSHMQEQKPGLFPLAYQFISRGLISGW